MAVTGGTWGASVNPVTDPDNSGLPAPLTATAPR